MSSAFTLKNGKFWHNPGFKLTVVADTTARDAIVDPVSGDKAYVEADGSVDLYSGTWGDDTALSNGFQTLTLTEASDSIENTDTNSPATVKESATGLAETTITTDGLLYDGSDVKVNGGDSALIFDSNDQDVTEFSYTRTFDEINCTNKNSASNVREFLTDRAEATTSFVVMHKSGETALTRGTATEITLQFKTGMTVVGDVEIRNREKGISDGETTKWSYEATFVELPVETGIPVDMASSGGWVAKDNDDNGVNGAAAVLTSKTLSINIDPGEGSQSKTYRINEIVSEFTT